MGGAVRLHPLYAVMACNRTTLPFPLLLLPSPATSAMQPPGGRRDNQSIPLGDRGLAGVPCVGSAVARAQ